QEDTTARDIPDRGAPDVPVREGRIEPREFHLDVRDVGGSEGRAMKGRELDRLSQILAAVADESLRRPSDQADSQGSCQNQRRPSTHRPRTLRDRKRKEVQ